MSAIDPIISKHDTSLTETSDGLSHLLLTPGSAREYERRRQAIRDASAPVAETPFMVLGSVGLVLLTLAFIFWIHGATGSVGSPQLEQLAPYALFASLPLLGVAGVIVAIDVRRETLRERRLKDLGESLGVQALFLSRYSVLGSLLGARGWEDVLTGVLNEVTPDVRDRLLGLIDQGKQDAAEEAVAILLREAKGEWERQNEKEAREALESRESLARRALGRRHVTSCVAGAPCCLMVRHWGTVSP